VTAWSPPLSPPSGVDSTTRTIRYCCHSLPDEPSTAAATSMPPLSRIVSCPLSVVLRVFPFQEARWTMASAFLLLLVSSRRGNKLVGYVCISRLRVFLLLSRSAFLHHPELSIATPTGSSAQVVPARTKSISIRYSKKKNVFPFPPILLFTLQPHRPRIQIYVLPGIGQNEAAPLVINSGNGLEKNKQTQEFGFDFFLFYFLFPNSSLFLPPSPLPLSLGPAVPTTPPSLPHLFDG